MKQYSALAIISAFGGVLIALLGGWDKMLETLIILGIVDYCTGLITALVFRKSPKTKTGGLSSKVGWRGLVKKGMVLVIVLVAHRIDLMLNIQMVRSTVILGFSINEAISIIENASLMGVPIPEKLKKSIELINPRAKFKEDVKKWFLCKRTNKN